MAGAKLTNVNYKGAGPAMIDLIGGSVQVGLFSVSVVKQQVGAGRLKALAISGDKRDAAFPDVQTFAEAGMKEFDPAGPLQLPLLAPSRTPRSIIEKLNAQVRSVLTDPETIAFLSRQGFSPVVMDVAQSEKLLPAELDRYGKLFKGAGLKPLNN